jgi:hypothetical protein
MDLARTTGAMALVGGGSLIAIDSLIHLAALEMNADKSSSVGPFGADRCVNWIAAVRTRLAVIPDLDCIIRILNRHSLLFYIIWMACVTEKMPFV